MPAPLSAMLCMQNEPQTSAACYEPYLQAKVDKPLTPVRQGAINFFAGYYPAPYYWLMNSFVSHRAFVSMQWMRFLNALIFIGLAFAVVLLASARLGRIFAITLIASVVPLGLFILTSINPSSWGFTGAGLSWAAALACAESSTRLKRITLGALTIVCVLLAIAARTDTGLLAVFGAVGGFFLSPTARAAVSRHRWISLSVAGATAAALAIIVFSAGQSETLLGPVRDAFPGTGGMDLAFANLTELPQLWVGMVGSWGGVWGLGALDTPMPAAVGVLQVSAIGALIFIGWRRLAGAKAIAIAAIGGVGLLVYPLLILQQRNEVVGSFVQPRYLLPMLPIFLGVSLLAANGKPATLALSRSQRWLLVVLLASAQAVALHQTIRRYVTGLDVHEFNLNSNVEWWWSSWSPSPMVIWLIGSLSFAVLVYLMLRLAREHPGHEAVAACALSG